MNEILLKLKNVGKNYRTGSDKIEVLKNLDWSIDRGKWVGLLGSSGSGKTTLLNLIGTLERPDSGTISFRSQDYAKMNSRTSAAFRNEKIGFIFQNYSLLPELSVLENVMLNGSIARPKAEVRKQAEKLIEEVGLAERITHRPAELSGGEQQRTAIARALINSPELLLADEPTGNLDEKTGEMILKLFGNLREQHPECTILMITHNNEIAKLTDEQYLLHDGAIWPQE